MNVETILTPAEIALLPASDLADAVCVVFDVLRATSSILTALGDGRARAVWPVATVEEARALKVSLGPDARLGGERGGRALAGFDLGNSPREYADPAVIGGRDVVTTTTNGTVALRACADGGARETLVGALLNLRALAGHLRATAPTRLVLVCAGTHAGFALEDAYGAGALLQALGFTGADASLPDSARAALGSVALYPDPLAALRASDNGRRLAEIGLDGDVPWCAAVSRLPLVPALGADGAIRA